MKKYKLPAFLAIILLAILAAGCSEQYTFQKSSVVPAAEAELEVDLDNNRNYTIDLSVDNLAPPENLSPARKTYVVWVMSNSNYYNVGQIVVDKNLSGSFHSTTPHKPEYIKITAEENATALSPGNQEVLVSDRLGDESARK